jgi:hypothetical protein
MYDEVNAEIVGEVIDAFLHKLVTKKTHNMLTKSLLKKVRIIGI